MTAANVDSQLRNMNHFSSIAAEAMPIVKAAVDKFTGDDVHFDELVKKCK